MHAYVSLLAPCANGEAERFLGEAALISVRAAEYISPKRSIPERNNRTKLGPYW